MRTIYVKDLVIWVAVSNSDVTRPVYFTVGHSVMGH